MTVYVEGSSRRTFQ